MRKGKTMWAILRDEKIYLIRPSKGKATQEKNILALAGYSKHQWRVAPVDVRPMYAPLKRT